MSKRFAKENCTIAVADINYKDALRTVAELTSSGIRAKAFKVDVSVADSVKNLKTEIESNLGAVDVLVNNAGICPAFSLRDCSDETIQRTIDVNLTSHFWTLRTFLPGMIERKYGRIVCICSFSVKLPVQGIIYPATKTALHGFMKSFYEELIAYGHDDFIKVTTAYPGFVVTRQELLDLVYENPLFLMISSAEDAADSILEGVVKHRREITIPRKLELMGFAIK